MIGRMLAAFTAASPEEFVEYIQSSGRERGQAAGVAMFIHHNALAGAFRAWATCGATPITIRQAKVCKSHTATSFLSNLVSDY